MKICFITSIPMSVNSFLKNHIKHLSKEHDVYVITNIKDSEFALSPELNTTNIHYPVKRQISLLSDVRALWSLYFILRANRFDCVQSVTPKAGLLGMTASFFARVPVRIHTFTGQVWANKSGVGRWVLKTMDKCMNLLSTHVIIDSNEQKKYLIEEGVVNTKKAVVLAHGSISGVDVERFKPNISSREKFNQKFNLPEGSVVFLMVGRFNKDKGILDLLNAFSKNKDKLQSSYLVLVGPVETIDIKNAIEDAVTMSSNRIIYEGYTSEPEVYYSAADVFCLPSYREGFGTSVIEAAACGVPSLGSDIYGLRDAIVDKQTGVFHNVGDVNDIGEKLVMLAHNKKMRDRLGEEACKRVRDKFTETAVTEALLDFYHDIRKK